MAATADEKQIARDGFKQAFQQQMGAVFSTLAQAFILAKNDQDRQDAVNAAEHGIARSLDLLRRLNAIVEGA